MRRRTFILGAIAVGGCPAAHAADLPVLRIAAAPLGHDIDPYLDAERGVDELAWLYGDGLTGWNGRLVPVLAQSLPETSHDGTVYHYRLRDAVWHDGRPLRASDVVDAFAKLRTTPWSTYDPYARVVDLAVRGPREIIVRLSAPYRHFAASFFGPSGYPALPLLRHDGGPVPLGTGPFAVRRRLDLTRWSLTRWTASPRGAAKIGGIELMLLGAEITANVQLLSGEADIALPLAPNAIGAERFARVTRVTSTAGLLINAEGLLRTPAMRRAFAAVADVPALQRAYDRRRKDVFASIMMEGPNDPSLAAALAYDPRLAADLEGVTRDRELVLAYVNGSPAHERTMTLLQQNLTAAGVRSALRPYPISVYTGPVGPLRRGTFDVAINGLEYGDDPNLAPDWSCANRPPHGANFARWCDPAFDRALQRPSPGTAVRLLYDDLPFVPLSRAYEYIGVGPRVGGFALAGPSLPATYLCAAWTIKP
jgi:ABC-type transport system substrate-binding protein